MREIHIHGHAVKTAQEFLAACPGAYHGLVITDFGYPFPEEIQGLCRDVLHLAFDDACFPSALQQLADLATVQLALAWAEGRDKLLVACHAGISRSSALAFLIACMDRPPEQALNLLDPGKHRPNDLVVLLGAKALGSPRVWETFVNWCRRHDLGDWHHSRRVLEEWDTKLDFQED